MFQFLRDLYDSMYDIDAAFPKTAKLLRVVTSWLGIMAYSLVLGTISSLLCRTIFDERLKYMPATIIGFGLIFLVLYLVLQIVRAWKLYSSNGIFKIPKYSKIAQERKDWLLSVDSGKFALFTAVNALLVSAFFTWWNFDVTVQIGVWHTSVDSYAIALVSLLIVMSAWGSVYGSIKRWFKCYEILDKRI